MKKATVHIYKAFRSIVVTALLLFVLFYSALYVALSVPAVQNRIRHIGETELSKLFGTKVSIGNIQLDPLNEAVVTDVLIPDTVGNPMIRIDKIGAGISIYDLVFNGRFTFNHAEIIGMDAQIKKATPDAPMNIQFLIDALMPDKPQKQPTKFDIRMNAVIIRKGHVTFDILSMPRKGKDIFDKNHIAISQINGDIRIPVIQNDSYTIDVRRFSFRERSGFSIENIAMFAHIGKQSIDIKNFKIQMAGSSIEPADMHISFNNLKTLPAELAGIPLYFKLKNSKLTLSDFKAFVPAMEQLDTPLFLSCDIEADSITAIDIKNITIHSDDLDINLSGAIDNLNNADSITARISPIRLSASAVNLAKQLGAAGVIPSKTVSLITKLRHINLDGTLNYANKKAQFDGSVTTQFGTLKTDGTASLAKTHKYFSGRLSSKRLKIGELTGKENLLGNIAFDIETRMVFNGNKATGYVSGKIQSLDLKGYRYENINADLAIRPDTYEGVVTLHDSNADIEISGLAMLKGTESEFDIQTDIQNVNLYNLHLSDKYPEHRLNTNINAIFTGNDIDNIEGDILVSNTRFTDNMGEGIKIEHFDITSRPKAEGGKYMTLNSDFVNGYIDGDVNFSNMLPEIREIAALALPSLQNDTTINVKTHSASTETSKTAHNNFSYYFKLAENDELTEFFNLPFTIVHPITIAGEIDAPEKRMSFGLDAPYFMQGKRILEKTNIAMNADGHTESLSINAASQIDNKNGNIMLLFNGTASADRADTDIEWVFDREKDFSGKISLSTLLGKAETGSFIADISVNPSNFVVNDTIWSIEQSDIHIADKKIHVNGLNINQENQFIKIDGIISDNHEESLAIQLQDIDLGYIFGTLNINHVAFSGNATGDFHASGLLSKSPSINTDNLHVDRFAYHNALLGDADIRSRWDNEEKGIIIDADIRQDNGRNTLAHGGVYLTRDSIAFTFDADHVNAQIIRPFMAAFASDVEGEASGHAELFGTFKLIDMKARLFADNFRLRINQTNTRYSVSDSIIIDPGTIRISGATVHDDYGNTAMLDGTIRHKYFKNVEFDFNISDVDNLLCFNTSLKENPTWYGTVFGNGNAHIVGIPGNIKIDINLSSAPNSTFNFVLSDRENAGEYTFVTFTDKRKEQELARQEAEKPDFLKKLEQTEANNSTQTTFLINLLADITPNLTINLIMDPDGGDKIRATGNGNMRIEYDSANDIKMFGNYTVEEGRYNFTLQDIIIKEFKINQGGTISFHGAPLNANVDLSANYTVNANLQDLDESFAQDKELNRTLVPVNAVLMLNGAISQPEISFDLQFPTLTQDVYRKVKSIVSTDDMMNQQIIYLLALNRFYTPEYMGATNRNNELASVASSTISGQLSSLLGQLSDNLTFAPNFHSDKGDFSDTEVELALSSHLLNNRLLLNGNFGYSDNAMNSNSFIGDFDIEYLLTKNGNIRLKAYNRYNDQNYYIRNALTTQGVGIMFKHDFNRIFKRRAKKETAKPEVSDSTAVRGDTVREPNARKPIRRPQ